MKRLLPLCLFIALMSGCAAPPPLNFSVPGVGVSSHKIDAELRSMTVTLARPDEQKGDMPQGIESITALWQTALQEALDRMAIFRDDSARRVNLQVKILAMDLPAFGIDMKTTTVARYEIIDRADGSIIFTQDIASEGITPGSHAYLGVTRAKESANRAVQNNITRFLQALETVDINTPMFPAPKAALP